MSVSGGEPDWLAAWRREMLDGHAALAHFDDLAALSVEAMFGRWRGVSLATGHPFDGLLEALGWYGKSFEGPARAHPLLFSGPTGVPVPLEPARVPLALALRAPRLARSSAMVLAFRAALPLLRTHRPAARLEQRTFRGKSSAAMVYRRLPITDHFRRIDADRVLGLMTPDKPGERYFYFLLSRAPDVAVVR